MQVARTPNGRWTPGVTGNPGGRPKIAPDVRSALEAGSLAAAQRLVELVSSEDERVSLAASLALLDRTLGKAAASLEVTGGSRPEATQAAVLAALARIHDDT